MKPETMNIIKMISKPVNERMPFEGVELTKFVQKLAFFKRFFPFQSEKFISLCLSSFLVEFRAGQKIYDKESKPDRIYIIVDGSLKVQSKESKIVRTIHACDLIGHVEVVFGLRERGQSIESLVQTSCMVMKSENFKMVWEQQEEVQKTYNYLRSNKYFEPLTDYDKKHLSLMMVKSSFKESEILALSGNLNDRVFFIIYGEAYVLKKLNIKNRQCQVIIDTLQEMDSYGQHESLNKIMSSVTLQAASSGTYYTINVTEVIQIKHPFIELARKKGLPYPDKEQLQFRFEVQTEVENYKKEVKKKLRLYK